MGLIHAFLLVSRDALFFEWSFGWGLWSANNLQEEGIDFIGNIFISIESG
ncbi:hypothetical protein QUF81_08870 [Peribacillus simplex]|uniref:Uncharacterized protein n=1 Tax=Peribacillus simplex TaxID=1478 RepID=A0AAW7I868_9BACI|nr:hypothetical protein [Peribacillus simplex]MDM5293292.1 hypothetical protein [Peribacillus simplex]MDM5452238.1 hypothetical protein [Peribacillus simplex]